MIRIPGGWYCDALPSGEYVALITDSHLATDKRRIELPHGQNLLYVRLAPDGIRFAGQIHEGPLKDHVFEWRGPDTDWHDHGLVAGVSPCIYDRAGVLRLNDGSWGSQGARFVDESNDIWTGDETYFSAPMELSEWSDIDGDALTLHVGQSHPDGTHDAAWVWDNGTLRLLEPGPCRFIRANREGERVSIAIWKPLEGAVIYWLTLDEIRALPLVSVPEPPPDDPTDEPEPPVPDHAATVSAIRAKYPTPLGDQHWRFLVEVAHATGTQLFRKDGGDHVLIPALGFYVSMDVVILAETRQWVDILGDSEGAAVPGWDVHDNAGEPEKWIDVSHVALPGEPDEPHDPPPAGDLASRVARLEAWARSFR